MRIELLFLPRNAVGHIRKKVETLPQLCHRFGDRPSWNRLLTRLEPVAHRLLREPGFCGMAGQQRRLGDHDLRELVLKRRSNTGMELLAAARAITCRRRPPGPARA